MKKIISVILAALMAVSVMTFIAVAEEAEGEVVALGAENVEEKAEAEADGAEAEIPTVGAIEAEEDDDEGEGTSEETKEPVVPHATNAYIDEQRLNKEQTEFYIRGWFGVQPKATEIGYGIGDGEPIFDGSITFYKDKELNEHAYSNKSYRFEGTISIDALQRGYYEVMIYVKAGGEIIPALVHYDSDATAFVSFTVPFTKSKKTPGMEAATTAIEGATEAITDGAAEDTKAEDSAAEAATSDSDTAPKDEFNPLPIIIIGCVVLCAAVAAGIVIATKKKK